MSLLNEIKELKKLFLEVSQTEKDIIEAVIEEGVDDPGILKCIFLAGGPGSGKSKVSKEIFGIQGIASFSASGLKSVNSDTAFEQQLKKSGIDPKDLAKTNYASLFFKGFFLNFINIGVLGFWLAILITIGPQLELKTSRMLTFFSTLIVTYFVTDIFKILLAKQLKHKLTPNNIYKIKRIISIVILIFGVFFILQGFFPKEKKMFTNKLLPEVSVAK